MHMTNILSGSGQRGICDVETGPHAHGRQDVSQGLNVLLLRLKIGVLDIYFSIETIFAEIYILHIFCIEQTIDSGHGVRPWRGVY